jgi:hypothetical protein
VTVVAQETVGPYETVQLSSQDAGALQGWLLSHGYNIPPDISPVISSYVNEGFDFLALKLVPGTGVEAMRPVRISTPGASATLPLRMVAAGTGAVTPITLWVLAEGRYEPRNFPSFSIRQQDLVWNWDEQRSNYAELKQAAFDATDGAGWLIEAGEPSSTYSIEYPLTDLVQYNTLESGYGDGNLLDAQEELTADLEKLYGGIPEDAFWINRFHGELTRQALGDDLDLQASTDQAPQPPCSDDLDDDHGLFGGQDDRTDLWGGASGSCAMERPGGAQAALGGLTVLAALALARRRRSVP